MVDNVALATAITALTNAIALLQLPPVQPAVFDPFTPDLPFNLNTRLGSQAYSDIAAPLDEVWNGDVSTFPSFIVALTLRAKKGKWNAAPPHGILEINGHNILTEYHSTTDAEIATARTGRVNNRAIQNSKAMFECISSSIEGDVRNTIFTQVTNIPEHEDGIALFKKLTTFTTVASVQLSLISLESILSFNPFDCKFHIPTINTKLINLFSLATTRTRILDESERIQHTLNAYSKILQPEIWAQWVRNRTDSFEDGTITVCQDFMNSAAIKYAKIDGMKGGFKGSVDTVHEDIVALLAAKAKSLKRKRQENEMEEDHTDRKKERRDNDPPFLKHFKCGQTGKHYAVGDTKDFKGTTYYFCDAPNHRFKTKWHKHHPDKCRLRKAWLKEKEEKETNPPPEANVGDAEENDDEDVSPDEPSNSNITALLASAMNLATDNDVVKDLIAEAINASTAQE